MIGVGVPKSSGHVWSLFMLSPRGYIHKEAKRKRQQSFVNVSAEMHKSLKSLLKSSEHFLRKQGFLYRK